MVERTDSKVEEQPIEHSTWNVWQGFGQQQQRESYQYVRHHSGNTSLAHSHYPGIQFKKKNINKLYVNYKASTMTDASNLYMWLWKQNNGSLILVDIDTETQNAPFWVSVLHSRGASRSTTRVSIGFQINFHWLLDICLGLRQCE